MRPAQEMLKKLGGKTTQVSFPKMLRVISDCAQLPLPTTVPVDRARIDHDNSSNVTELYSLWRGIIPVRRSHSAAPPFFGKPA